MAQNDPADLYSTGNGTLVREHMVESLSARFPESVIASAIYSWLVTFSAASHGVVLRHHAGVRRSGCRRSDCFRPLSAEHPR
jgi:hypothetical protein